MSFEREVMRKLKYRLSPPLHTYISQELIINWNKEIENKQFLKSLVLLNEKLVID
jgi:hypothetical protein